MGRGTAIVKAGPESLKRWLSRTYRLQREEGPVVRLLLRRRKAYGNGWEDVELFDTPDDVACTDETLRDLEETIETTITTDAYTRSGKLKYDLFAFAKHGRTHVASYGLVRDGEGNDEDEDGGQNEQTGSPRSMLNQAYRHIERKENAYQLLANVSIQALAAENQDLRRRLSDHESKRLEMFDALENLRTQQAQRDLDKLKSEKLINGMDDMFQYAKTFMPVLTEAFLQTKGGAQTPLDAIVEEMVQKVAAGGTMGELMEALGKFPIDQTLRQKLLGVIMIKVKATQARLEREAAEKEAKKADKAEKQAAEKQPDNVKPIRGGAFS